EAFRIMKKQKGGRIINIGSISAQRVRPGSAPYSASKHGLWGLTQVTALEGREFGISCGCLHPGNVLVERRQDSDKIEDQEPMMTVEELARSAVLMATLPAHVNIGSDRVAFRTTLYRARIETQSERRTQREKIRLFLRALCGLCVSACLQIGDFMPTLIGSPARIQAAGNKPKIIDEYVGRVNSRTEAVSIAHMRSPSGWVEPGQKPEFDEYTLVLKG